MAGKTILVVDDEQSIRDLVAFGLRRSGFAVELAADALAARTLLASRRPDLLLVDWMLPDTSGLELTRQLRRDPATRDLPVILLTARAGEQDKVNGLEGGADDYITKPFSARELVARIQAVLRRSSPAGADGLVAVGELTLDEAAHRITASGQPLALGPTEYRLLVFFMTHADRVWSRAQLLDRVWGGDVYVDERTVDVHIRRLRQALEPSGCDRFVQTVRGAGYRFSRREA
ncbi:MAG: phosphate regulon transcriptional regulatory protein PhoB [Gammaproteobacteria bacterium]|nr:phosphate regulon transcriptional regulatory protein PhoB [Gammaproteobacteria bacterium]